MGVEDTKVVVRIRKSKTNRQYNDQKEKRTNNDLRNITTQKTKDKNLTKNRGWTQVRREGNKRTICRNEIISFGISNYL